MGLREAQGILKVQLDLLKSGAESCVYMCVLEKGLMGVSEFSKRFLTQKGLPFKDEDIAQAHPWAEFKGLSFTGQNRFYKVRNALQTA